jgi:hypothetical protein
VQLAAHVAVQKELGLSGETTSKINALHENYLAAKREALDAAKLPTGAQIAQGLSREEMHKSRQKQADVSFTLENEFTPKLKELLSADQMKRLKQIQVQRQGTMALTVPEVASELALTEDQLKNLDDLREEQLRKLQKALREDIGGGGNYVAKRGEIAVEMENKSLELLTAEQKAKYEALKGSPFDISQLARTSPAGRRGKN